MFQRGDGGCIQVIARLIDLSPSLDACVSPRNRYSHAAVAHADSLVYIGDDFSFFYRAMLSIRGTSHGPVSVSVSVCHKSEFYLNG